MTRNRDGWSDHEESQRVHRATASPEQRLAWLEEAQAFVAESLGAAFPSGWFRDASDVIRQRGFIARAEGNLRESLRARIESPTLAEELKFDLVGFDPTCPDKALNLVEQLNQTATWVACLDALEILMIEHAGKRWHADPSASGRGPDIRSMDGEVAAEVFAAVDVKNNAKLAGDVARLAEYPSKHRYVFFRARRGPTERVWERGGIIVVPLAART